MEITMSQTTPKTKALGTISADKAKKIIGFVDYAKAAKALTDARKAVMASKVKVKEQIKKVLGDDGDLDFLIETNGQLRVWKNLVEKKGRITTPTTPDLSDKF